MISKELLSEVLNKNFMQIAKDNNSEIAIILDESTIEIDFNYEHIEFESYTHDTVNIHELAHKCKEWAHSRGYTIFSAYKYHCYLYSVDDILQHPDKFRVPNDFAIGTSSEAEAIFAACQWILDNKEG